ncbi:MAG: hypothetical protein SF172_11830 [Burkholderiales bacterium]|nr:hypothetical protein [Burkholderiales bacterium]
MRIFATSFLLVAFNAIAGPGHDHGDEGAKAPTGNVSPRFEAHSDLFEVVGILDGKELAIFIDRFADNAPVHKAKVELESGSVREIGQFHADHGDYSFAATAFQKPGSYPITLTITVGDEVDILAANLVVPDAHAADTHATEAPKWMWWAGGGALLVVIAFIAFLRRQRSIQYAQVHS